MIGTLKLCMAMKYDPRQPKKSRPTCGVSRKRIFKSNEAALQFAGELPADDGRPKPIRAYRCLYCGGWHLTSQPCQRNAPQISRMTRMREKKSVQSM